MNSIDRIDAKGWKNTLRNNYLQLFDDLFSSLDEIKNSKLKEINQIFWSIDLREVNSSLNEMKVSHDMAVTYSKLVNKMFDQN